VNKPRTSLSSVGGRFLIPGCMALSLLHILPAADSGVPRLVVVAPGLEAVDDALKCLTAVTLPALQELLSARSFEPLDPVLNFAWQSAFHDRWARIIEKVDKNPQEMINIVICNLLLVHHPC
jgi:hypothetical protein